MALVSAAMLGSGLLLALMAGFVAWRKPTRSGLALGVLLGAASWWALAYGIELAVAAVEVKSFWGDVKYVGISLIAPSWLVFVLLYTGRNRLVTRGLLVALSIEPVALIALLVNDATHDLVRSYPPDAAGQAQPIVETGPAFWANLVYANVLVVVASAIFVLSMARLARTYLWMALVLVAATMLPWAANLLHNFEVGWFAYVDLTPVGFVVTGAVLVVGVFRQRLVRVSPLARSAVVHTMSDGVLVVDAFARVVDVNPAGCAIFDRSRGELLGTSTEELLRPASSGKPAAEADQWQAEQLQVGDGEQRRTFDLSRQQLTDRGGALAGELVVLREITERVRDAARLQELLAERSRVAEALQASLLPAELPTLPGCVIATGYEPAGDGTEIGGDFFDVFPLDDGRWGLVLGDVSGKGAEAAAVTALTRYTLRAIAAQGHCPSIALRELNARLLSQTAPERYCTLVYAVGEPTDEGLDLTLCLAGHHPPLVARSCGEVVPVGELGTALGLLENPELTDARVLLAPDELVCLFTDGLVEARDGTDLFGTDRVASLVSAHRDCANGLVHVLVDAAKEWSGGRLTDDLAILTIAVASHPGPVATGMAPRLTTGR